MKCLPWLQWLGTGCCSLDMGVTGRKMWFSPQRGCELEVFAWARIAHRAPSPLQGKRWSATLLFCSSREKKPSTNLRNYFTFYGLMCFTLLTKLWGKKKVLYACLWVLVIHWYTSAGCTDLRVACCIQVMFDFVSEMISNTFVVTMQNSCLTYWHFKTLCMQRYLKCSM